MVMRAAMDALRLPDNSGTRQASDSVPETTLSRQVNNTSPATFRRQQLPLSSHSKDLMPLTSLQRQSHPDKAYLKMLKARDPSPANARFVSALEAALGTPEQTSAMINRALREQMQSFQERQRKVMETEEQTPVSESKPAHAAVKPVAAKSSLAMSQKQVAHLHDMAKNGQADSAKSKFPKAVRRASAA